VSAFHSKLSVAGIICEYEATEGSAKVAGERAMNTLPWASFGLSILSFFWIGLRRDRKEVQARVREAHSVAAKIKSYSSFGFPYVLGACGLAYLLITALGAPSWEIRHHALREITTADGQSVEADGRTQVDVASTREHFEIVVQGQIFGPELKQLKDHFGSLNEVRVYILVAEESRPRTRGLCWLQKEEFGSLDARGTYVSRAYLGGTGRDKADNGDLFSIRVYIPDRSIQFADPTAYALDQLPKAVFVSEPLYIKTHRPSERHGELLGTNVGIP